VDLRSHAYGGVRGHEAKVTVKVSPTSPNVVVHTTHFQCLDLYFNRRTSKGGTKGVCHSPLDPIPSLTSTYTAVDGRRSSPNQPLQGEPNFGDSSWPLFSMYSKAADVEDKKKVDQWQKDADGILIFVSPRV
jgi:hypothetical protein